MEPTLPREYPPQPPRGNSWAVQLTHFLSRQFEALFSLLMGGLRWQNLRSELFTGTTPGTANTEFSLTHSLGKVPELFIANLDAAGSVYASGTAWTTTTLYLKCDVASAAYTILVL